MAITVGTNSYVTEAELATYASDRGITIVSADTKPLLIKAMDYIESRNFIGTKTVYNQALQFPRILCGDIYDPYVYCEYDSLTVPQGIKNAQMIAALLIDGGNDLQAVIGQAVKREKVDVLEIEYQDNTTSRAQYTSLNDALRPFLNSGIRGERV